MFLFAEVCLRITLEITCSTLSKKYHLKKGSFRQPDLAVLRLMTLSPPGLDCGSLAQRTACTA